MAASIGLGSVTFGREIDEAESFKLMDHAYEMGIRDIDTAAAYGGGASETIVGRWLTQRGLHQNISIATKILPPYDVANISKAVNDCLTRLNTDVIDILYLHRWDDALHAPEAWQELDKLHKQGKFKALAVSNFNTAQLTHTLNLLTRNKLLPLSYIQNNHNLAVSDVTVEMQQLCAQNNINIITYSPLGAGFLTGKHRNGIQENSRFAIMPAHQDVYMNAHAQKRLEKLMWVADSIGAKPALLAMAWALHQPQVYQVLVGGRTVEQLDLATRAMKFYLPEIFAELESD